MSLRESSMVWFTVVLVLGLLSFAVALGIVGLGQLSLGMVLSVSALVFVTMGMTFMVAVWLTNWLNSPGFSRTRQRHEIKMLRHENTSQKRMLHAQQRLIGDLEAQVQRLQDELQNHLITQQMPPPPTGTGQMPAVQTGPQPRIETRPMPSVNDTGEYRLINTPSYTAKSHTGTHPAVQPGSEGTARETGLYQPVRDTGEHPIRQTGRFPRPKSLPGNDDPRHS
jgi:hypothetical protein